jgi:hypothetical protein
MHSAKFAAVSYSKQLEEFVCGANAIKYLMFALTIVTHVNLITNLTYVESFVMDL